MSSDNPLIESNSGAEANQSTGTGWRWVMPIVLVVIVAAVGAWLYYRYYLDGRCRFGSTTRDCAGKCGGDAVVDCEGTCGGKAGAPNDAGCCGELTKDCADTCGGALVLDCEGTCGGKLTKDCAGTCGGDAVVDCEGTCGGTAEALKADGCCGECPSSVFLNETWNNGTKSFSGTYVRDGTHNEKPVYKRSQPGGMYIFYATGVRGDTRTEYWVLLDKIQDNEWATTYPATATGKSKSEKNLERVEFEFHNGAGWVIPDKVQSV